MKLVRAEGTISRRQLFPNNPKLFMSHLLVSRPLLVPTFPLPLLHPFRLFHIISASFSTRQTKEQGAPGEWCFLPLHTRHNSPTPLLLPLTTQTHPISTYCKARLFSFFFAHPPFPLHRPFPKHHALYPFVPRHRRPARHRPSPKKACSETERFLIMCTIYISFLYSKYIVVYFCLSFPIPSPRFFLLLAHRFPHLFKSSVAFLLVCLPPPTGWFTFCSIFSARCKTTISSCCGRIIGGSGRHYLREPRLENMGRITTALLLGRVEGGRRTSTTLRRCGRGKKGKPILEMDYNCTNH